MSIYIYIAGSHFFIRCIETLFHQNEQLMTARLKKIVRKFGRRCINKKHQMKEQWKTAPKKVAFKELEPIDDVMCKGRLGFLGHIMRKEYSRLVKLENRMRID